MARKVLVKVCKPVFPPNGPWRIYDQKREHEDNEVDPADLEPWVREVMSGRYEAFFLAIWSLDYGWQIKKRVLKKYHWFDEEGNEI